jgi:hypothetical protein
MTASRPLAVLLLATLSACAPDALTRADAGVAGPSLSRSEGTTTGTTRDGTGGTSSTPTFLQSAAGAPTIANPVVSFWAKRGRRQTAEMYYHAAPGSRDSAVFFSLRLRERSLARRPDGRAFADGDSVLVTLTLVDPERMVVDCQPSGLRFSSGDPVRLKMSFLHTDDDMNHDGVVDGSDASAARRLTIWRKETAVTPWQSLASDVEIGTHEVEAEIGGFTGYVIAW